MLRRPGRAVLLPALLALTAACAAAPPPRTAVLFRTGSIGPETVRRHVEELCALGPRHHSAPESQAAALDWLRLRLAGYGYEPVDEVFQAATPRVEIRYSEDRTTDAGEPLPIGTSITTPFEPHVNLIAEKRGLVEPEVVIEVVAHYDTVPATVGAIDNASGVAALLEVARVCADAPTERTLRFVFTAMEEHGLQGARAHVRLLQARAEAGTERLDAALVLDPVGVTNRAPDSQDSPVRIPFLFWPPSTGDFLGVFGNWGSSGVAGQVQQVAERYAPDLATYTVKRLTGMLDDGRRSDHAPYWDAGYQAVWLCDTFPLRAPGYHQPSDTPALLDAKFCRDAARVAAAWALERAGLMAFPAGDALAEWPDADAPGDAAPGRSPAPRSVAR